MTLVPRVNAQTRGSIAGVVNDETGAALAGVVLMLTDERSGTKRQTTTDGTGRFRVEDLAPGRYTVTADLDGFRSPAPLTVAVTAGTAADASLTLFLANTTDVISVVGRRSTVATKAATPVMETPQAIAVVPREILAQQLVANLGEALRNTSGAMQAGNWRGTYENYAQRGFVNNSDGNFRRNGVEVSKFIQFVGANAESVEVMKGPASVLYGRLDPGGVINIVTKQPQPAPFRQVEIRAGSYGLVDGRVDLTGPIAGGAVAYRLNASGERRDSYRNEVSGRSFFAAPVVTATVGGRFRATAEVDARRDENTVDLGIAAPTSSFDDFDVRPIDTFLGEPDAEATLQSVSALGTVEQTIGSSWLIRGVLNTTQYDREPRDVVLGALRPDGRTLARTADYRLQDYSYRFGEVTALGSVNTGAVSHRLAIGTSYQSTTLDEVRRQMAIAPVDIISPSYVGIPADDAVPITSSVEQQVRIAAFFAQDQIALGERIRVQAGVRHTTFEHTDLNRRTDRTTRFEASSTTPQLGVVWLASPAASAYASYARSFAPTLSVLADGSIPPPNTGEQVEVGLKTELLERRLSVTAAVFDLKRANILSFVRTPAGTFDTVVGGRHGSTGLELDVVGQLRRSWNVMASYGYLNGRVLEDRAFPAGTAIGGAPRHKASVWTTIGVTERLSAGGGVFYQDRFKDFTSSTALLPSRLTADVTTSYRIGTRASVRASVKNLFNARYYLSGAGTNVAYPAPPRTLQIAVVSGL